MMLTPNGVVLQPQNKSNIHFKSKYLNHSFSSINNAKMYLK